MKKLIMLVAVTMVTMMAFGAAPTKGLVAYYPFDGDAKDKSGNHNDGIMVGTRPTADRKGRLNSAMLFGEGNYITVPSSPSLNSPKDQITITAWVRIGEWCRNWAPIICKGRDMKSDQYRFLGRHGGDTLLSTCHNIDARFENSSMLRGAWHHVAVSYDGNMAKAYIDGCIAGLRHSPGNFKVSNEELLIGCDPPGAMEWLFGAMDELRIYNRALSDDEIKAVYEADPTTKTNKKEIKGWHVMTYDRTVRSIGDAEATVQSEMGKMSEGDYPVLAFTNVENAPYPELHSAFPGKSGCLVMRANGTVRIPSAGMWTLGISCDDGAKIRIKGKDFVDVIVAGCAWNQRFPINIPAAGDYELEVTFFDYMKGCVFVFSAAKGNWAMFDKSEFRLVGDPECEIKMVENKSAAKEKATSVADESEGDAMCPDCKGEKVKWVRCKKCRGKGTIVKTRTLASGGTVKENLKCPDCSSANTPERGKGRGRVRVVCPTCNGEGSVGQ